MRASTTSRAAAHRPSFSGLMCFSARLMLGRKLYAVILLLVMVLISGHMTMPGDLRAYDDGKHKEAQDINGIAAAFLEAYNMPGDMDEHATTIAFWSQLQEQSRALMQSYNVMRRYNRERPAGLDEGWNTLYTDVLKGLEQGLIAKESDVLLRIGPVQMIEDNIYNNARKAMGLQPAELRPRHTRTQYWRNLLSGSHYFSIAPFVVLMLLLHGSFSIDHESGSEKTINSLPVSSISRNAARLLGQGLFAVVLVLMAVLLCSLTYPPGGDAFYLGGHGKLLSFETYLSHNISYAEHLLPAEAYFLRAGGLYGLSLLFFCLLTMLLSASIKNSILALLLPITLLLILYMPNYMQTSLGKLPPPYTALFSPQLVLEAKAALSFPVLSWLYMVGGLIYVSGILFTGYPGRRRHVDQA